jgi:hypothetical protein
MTAIRSSPSSISNAVSTWRTLVVQLVSIPSMLHELRQNHSDLALRWAEFQLPQLVRIISGRGHHRIRDFIARPTEVDEYCPFPGALSGGAVWDGHYRGCK